MNETNEREAGDAVGVSPLQAVVRRLERKLARRDRKIAGMRRRIALLESALATRTLDLGSLSRNVERAVTSALCNVRMIPVIGVGRDAKIVEVKAADA